MIEVLENVRSLINEEITKRTTFLKRRRNQEHASIYKLPYEVFAEIILLASSASMDISETRKLMRVSKYWCDTVVQCPHIWSRVDVATGLRPGDMSIVRMLRGPVEVRCQGIHLDISGALAYLDTLEPTRLQALVWSWTSLQPEALHSFFRKRNSNIVSLAVERMSGTRRIDLSPDGPPLRHVNLSGIALPWTSPRLSQLRTLVLENLDYGEGPSIDDIYRILGSSPALQRIRLQHLRAQGDEASLPTKKPLALSVLLSIQFIQVPPTIPNVLLPLLRAPACRYLDINSPDWAGLEPRDATLELIINSMASQSTLNVQVGYTEGDLWVIMSSFPEVKRDALGDQGDPDTGISIKFFPSTVEGLRSLIEGLISSLQAANWKPTSLHLSMYVFEDVPGIEVVPILCRLPLSFQTITQLRIDSTLPSTYSSVLHLLQDGIPKLMWFYMRAYQAVSYDRNEWANGIKAFLERRYPRHAQGGVNVPQPFDHLYRIGMPNDVAECLRRSWPSTSLSMEELLKR